MRTLGNIFLLIVILIIGIVSLGYYWTFSRPIPNPSASYSIAGLQDSVFVYWDDHHVPHIKAKNEDDLYYAFGFVHAQERLWQMTMVQLAGEGRFSEFFGEDLIPLDKYQRMIGYWRMAEKVEPTLSERERNVLLAYSRGINDWVNQHKKALPVEFSLAQMDPIPWDIKHSLVLIRLLAWDLNVSWWPELTYSRLASKVSESEFKALIPEWGETHPSSIDYEEWKKTGEYLGSLLDKEFEARKYIGSFGSHIGSNAWVVDGKKTKTGFPLLAGDPHLGFSIPILWFEIHASLNGRELSGVTHPGAPVFVIGQNDFMAWSLTNIMADDTDFYLERFDPKDRGRYVASYENGKPIYKAFEYDRTYLKQKNGEEKVSEIRFTQNGVVVSDFMDDSGLPDSLFITMRWTGHEISNEYGMMLKLNWADSFETVKNLVPEFTVPGQNLMYADRTGNIAMFSMARLPIRKQNPLLLGEGWNPDHRWQGWIPSKEMPAIINPERGWIANANNQLVSGKYPHYIGTFYEPDSRYRAIKDVLSSKEIFTETDFSELQNSSFSHHAKDITHKILPILEKETADNDIKTAFTYLSNWNFEYEQSESAASIFETFYIKLFKNTIYDEADSVLYHQLIKSERIPIRIMAALLDTESSLFDNKKTDEVETKATIVIQSMKEAIAELRKKLGNETYNWRWENLHTLTLDPMLFGQAAKAPGAPSVLKMIVKNVLSRGPYGVRGSGTTVNNGEYNWDNAYQMTVGASVRRIVDLSDLRTIQSVIPGGQSGIPMSDYYDDQIELWLNGTYKTLIQDMKMVEKQDFPRMTLIPNKK